ncbi:hypothetical protein GWI33_020195 [Rhynchophorus ferrugineus]|uniref:Uncharacterized protein n=1 Tax=Rhynchophorus ferrugineus TaxID=354439 RepID=A0A834HR40_RHYFE|nr:hypothetical protein GWI33_020195 [Rhynchophorus ferrugineus]
MEITDDAIEINEPVSISPIIVRKSDEHKKSILPEARPGPSKEPDNLGSPVKEVIDLVEKCRSNKCINMSSHFRFKKSSNNQEEICIDCFNQAVTGKDKIATNLINGQLLFNVDFPIINETLQVDDCHEETENLKEMEYTYISHENFKFINNNIEDLLIETIDKF